MNTRWIATMTVSVMEENLDDYQGDDPVEAARLAFLDIKKLTAPIINVQRQTSTNDFFDEPDLAGDFVVDLELGEVIDS